MRIFTYLRLLIHIHMNMAYQKYTYEYGISEICIWIWAHYTYIATQKSPVYTLKSPSKGPYTYSKNPRQRALASNHMSFVLQCVAVCCSVLQCVAVCCSVLQHVAVFKCVAAWALHNSSAYSRKRKRKIVRALNFLKEKSFLRVLHTIKKKNKSRRYE